MFMLIFITALRGGGEEGGVGGKGENRFVQKKKPSHTNEDNNLAIHFKIH